MNIPIYFDRVATPLGTMLLATDGDALIGAWFDGQRYFPSIDAWWQQGNDAPVLRRAKAMLAAYFDGGRAHCDVALAPRGTPFQRAVWKQFSAAIAGLLAGRTPA